MDTQLEEDPERIKRKLVDQLFSPVHGVVQWFFSPNTALRNSSNVGPAMFSRGREKEHPADTNAGCPGRFEW